MVKLFVLLSTATTALSVTLHITDLYLKVKLSKLALS